MVKKKNEISKKSKNDERAPSLDGLRSAVTEMMEMKKGNKPKSYVKRKNKKL